MTAMIIDQSGRLIGVLSPEHHSNLAVAGIFFAIGYV